MRHRAKFRAERSNRCGDMTVFYFSSRWWPVFGPPTKSIWWSLSLCKLWFESVQ